MSVVKSRMTDVLGPQREGRSTVDILGCDIQTFRLHIEAKWHPGMSWNNHTSDGWHIDHIIPLAWNNPTVEQVLERLHYTNCQPLWAAENKAKGNRYAPEPVKLTDEDVEALLADLGI